MFGGKEQEINGRGFKVQDENRKGIWETRAVRECSWVTSQREVVEGISVRGRKKNYRGIGGKGQEKRKDEGQWEKA